jgi:hypothetical protein
MPNYSKPLANPSTGNARLGVNIISVTAFKGIKLKALKIIDKHIYPKLVEECIALPTCI